MDIKGTILRAKDGHPVPVLEREGLKRHLGSMYDGAVAASCWCEKVASKRTENIILFGMGDCRIVLELIEKVPGQILIYEPESFVFSQMRTSNLYKKAVKCRRVKIFQASECAKFACFADERSNQIPVLGSSNTRTEFLKRNTAKKIWGFDHEQILMMQKRAGIEISQVPYYLGVSTAMLSSAIEFGAKNIIFVGQDLAYASDGSSHTNGKKEYYADANGIETDGYYGDKVYSRMDWLEFKDWFEKMIALYPSITVTNATEGGVRIEGTIQKPLKEVCQEFLQTGVCFADFLEAKDNQITEQEAALMREQMAQCVRDLEAVRSFGYDVTFFEKEYHQFPVMSMILSYMKILEGDRRERFETALSFVSDELEKGGWADDDLETDCGLLLSE